MKFEINLEEQMQIDKWIAEQKEITNPLTKPAIGGRWTYQFTPTSIGAMISIIDNYTGAKFEPEVNW